MSTFLWSGEVFLKPAVCLLSHSAAGTEETDFVNAKEAKAKIPQVSCWSILFSIILCFMQVVIDFYEEKLAWFTGEDSQEEE